MILTILQAGTILFVFVGVVLVASAFGVYATRNCNKSLAEYERRSNERLRVQQEKWERLERAENERLAKLFEDDK